MGKLYASDHGGCVPGGGWGIFPEIMALEHGVQVEEIDVFEAKVGHVVFDHQE